MTRQFGSLIRSAVSVAQVFGGWPEASRFLPTLSHSFRSRKSLGLSQPIMLVTAENKLSRDGRLLSAVIGDVWVSSNPVQWMGGPSRPAPFA